MGRLNLDEIKEQFQLMNDFTENREMISNKMTKFADIIDREFDNGFGKFLFERIPLEDVKGVDSKFSELSAIKNEMTELANAKGINNLARITELAKSFISKSNELSEFFDQIFDYYEEYNLQ